MSQDQCAKVDRTATELEELIQTLQRLVHVEQGIADRLYAVSDTLLGESPPSEAKLSSDGKAAGQLGELNRLLNLLETNQGYVLESVVKLEKAI